MSDIVSIEARLSNLDTSLFNKIVSQTSTNDRRSMLAIQCAVAAKLASFTYLEIGSHLGGSLQPFLLDNRCASIISIDKRPMEQPDARGTSFAYPENSTARMLENLRNVASNKLSKVATLDADSSQLDPSMLPSRAEVCFIDGEHTNAATERDFAFCESVLKDPGVIYFHDSNIVFQAIAGIVRRLTLAGKQFRAYNLPDAIFVIDFGLDLHSEENIQNLLAENHLGYLSALESMAHYRDVYNSRIVRAMRSVTRPARIVADTLKRTSPNES